MRHRVQELAQPGRNIHAYCNVRTHQVLYSLTKFLKPRALAQLPDIGANHTPPSLRKDSWRPLWTVTLPDTPSGRAQGLNAFRRLREYRKLHETCWEPSAQLSRPYTEKEIAEMQKKLDDRGGSKVESVYDIIKREKHKMKVHAVMDQRANSIADLAAVLQEQEDFGAKSADPQDETREVQMQEMIALAKSADQGGLEDLTEQIENYKARRMEQTLVEKQKAPTKDTLMFRRQKMIFAQKAVAHAKERAEELRGEQGDAQKKQVADAGRQGATEEEHTGEVEHDYKQFLPAFPDKLDRATWNLDLVPKKERHLVEREMKRRRAPRFAAAGVTVQWTHMLDAEFAASWPADVIHERMARKAKSTPSPPKRTKSAEEMEEETNQKRDALRQKAAARRRRYIANLVAREEAVMQSEKSPEQKVAMVEDLQQKKREALGFRTAVAGLGKQGNGYQRLKSWSGTLVHRGREGTMPSDTASDAEEAKMMESVSEAVGRSEAATKAGSDRDAGARDRVDILKQLQNDILKRVRQRGRDTNADARVNTAPDQAESGRAVESRKRL